ncbi:hypothetical protein [Halopiger thermotolerans]
MAARSPQGGRVDEWPSERIQHELEKRREAEAVAGPEPAVRADGSGEENTHVQRVNQQLRMAEDDDTMTDETDIKPGDVALDLAQGRPVHVLEDTEQTALEWTNEYGYDLLENYGNARFNASADDRVFDVVYCSSVKSEPNKTYAFPESRLMRIETEKADGGRQVFDRIVATVLEELFLRAAEDDEQAADVLEQYAKDASSKLDSDIPIGAVHEARELAEAARLTGGDE